MILGEHVALALAREVTAAVADVRDEAAQLIAGAGDEQHGGGGAHAALVGLGLRARVDRAARGLHGVLEHLEDLVRLHARVVDAIAIEQVALVVHRVADLVHGDRRGDLAGGVPSHAIGDQEQPQLLVDEEVVLVELALAADIGRCGKRQLHLFTVYLTATSATSPGRPGQARPRRVAAGPRGR